MPETKQNSELAEEPDVFDWDEVVKKAAESPDILPTLKMDVGDVTTVTIKSQRPRIVTFKDKKTGESKTFPLIEVIDHEDQNTRKGLGVGAVSLQNAIGKIAAKRGGIEEAKVRISCIQYKHPKFGNVRGYRAELIEDEAV